MENSHDGLLRGGSHRRDDNLWFTNFLTKQLALYLITHQRTRPWFSDPHLHRLDTVSTDVHTHHVRQLSDCTKCTYQWSLLSPPAFGCVLVVIVWPVGSRFGTLVAVECRIQLTPQRVRTFWIMADVCAHIGFFVREGGGEGGVEGWGGAGGRFLC